MTEEKLFNRWRTHLSSIIEEENAQRDNIRIHPDTIIPVEQNSYETSRLVKEGAYVPKAVKENYRMELSEKTIRTPIWETMELPSPLQRSSTRGSCILLIGAAGSGKSSLIRSYFTNAFGSNQTSKTITEHRFSQALSCSCGGSVALGRYGLQVLSGLDAITDKGPQFVQAFIAHAWNDPTIENLFFEGVHVTYFSFHRVLRRLQQAFHRDIYLVCLDVDVETQIQRVLKRTGGLKYDRKSIKPSEPDKIIAFNWCKKAIKTWETLKILHKDDDELIRGEKEERLFEYNTDGTKTRSRHFRLISTIDRTQEDVLRELYGFVKFPTCSCVRSDYKI